MPVRHIPANHRSLTGRHATGLGGKSIGFESSFERDFVTLMLFDPKVINVEEQPVCIRYAPGAKALLHDRPCTIKAATDVDQVLVQFNDSGETVSVAVSNLKECPGKVDRATRPVDAIPDEDLDVAQQRLDAIRPLLDLDPCRKSNVDARAKEIGVGASTLQRWIKTYKSNNRLSDLAPNRGGKRKNRLSKKVEAIVQEVIETVYLTKQKVSGRKVIDEVIRQCKAARVKPPHANTVRARINAVSERKKPELISGKNFFNDEDFAAADHMIEGRFDEYGQFCGTITFYRESTREFVCNWAEGKGRQTRCGAFDFRLG